MPFNDSLLSAALRAESTAAASGVADSSEVQLTSYKKYNRTMSLPSGQMFNASAAASQERNGQCKQRNRRSLRGIDNPAAILPDQNYEDSSLSPSSSPSGSGPGPEGSIDEVQLTSDPTSLSSSSNQSKNGGNRLVAVALRDAKHTYSRADGPVLDGLSMTVREGEIYGLLGPSGCGKTTLLRTIVGRLKPPSGLVEVFGFEPGEAGSSVPGATVGYMPQEVALYDDYTIGEVLYYFGRLYRTEPNILRERIRFLVEFLDLPEAHRMIYTLSGGQKRRVSFAAALVHKPPLVILDEPTAGVDPLLRSKMWSHLRRLAETEMMTIIVTTHYIEEARQAHAVGFMRGGKILAEGPPQELLRIHRVATLEDVFLKLCIKQIQMDPRMQSSNHLAIVSAIQMSQDTNGGGFGHGHPGHGHGGDCFKPDLIQSSSYYNAQSGSVVIGGSPTGTTNATTKPGVIRRQLSRLSSAYSDRESDRKSLSPNDAAAKSVLRTRVPKNLGFRSWFITLWTLFVKNFIRNLRHPALIVFQCVLPAIQVVLFCLCIGRDPIDIRIAFVNEDMASFLPRLFSSSIDRYATDIIEYPSLETGLAAARKRDVWGVLHVPQNFSAAIQSRLDFDDSGIDNTTLKSGRITLYADLTDKLITIYVQRILQDAFQNFAKGAVVELDLNPMLAQFPIKLERAVHGSIDTVEHRGYTEYMAPGVIVSVTYVMACGLTALLFIMERNEGMFERTLVAGVDTGQMLIAHAMNRILYMFIQMCAVMLVVFWIFAIPIKGNIFIVWLLLVLQNCAGMACGILVSSICRYQETATIVVVGLMFVNLFMSGIIWPLEAIPLWIRWLAVLQPSTLSVESLRSIISRGFGFEAFSVWIGFASTIAWLTIFMLAASRVIKHVVISPK